MKKTDTQEIEKVKVRFYMEMGNTPLAVFQSRKRINNGHRVDLRECYSHVGQHSTAAPEYIKRLRKAKPDEYKSLLDELNSIGYEVTVL